MQKLLCSHLFSTGISSIGIKKTESTPNVQQVNSAFAKTQLVAAFSSEKKHQKTQPCLWTCTDLYSIWTEQHVEVQLLHWLWPQDTLKVTQHGKNAAGIVICFPKKAQLRRSTCFSVRSCLSPDFQWGWLGYKRRSSDLPKVTQWVAGSRGIRIQEAPGSTFLGLISSPCLLHQPLALSFAKQRLHVVTLLK